MNFKLFTLFLFFILVGSGAGWYLMNKSFHYFSLPVESRYKNITSNLSYVSFARSWNRALIQFLAVSDNRILEKLSLPERKEKGVEKLNSIFAPSVLQNKIKWAQSKLTGDQMIDIPLKKYISFLQQFKFKQNIFNTQMNEKDIEKNILIMLNETTPYFTIKTLQKLQWIYSFEDYFKNNKEKFYKNGFSHNLKDFKKYISIISSP
jgi:hypothetical protein